MANPPNTWQKEDTDESMKSLKEGEDIGKCEHSRKTVWSNEYRNSEIMCPFKFIVLLIPRNI